MTAFRPPSFDTRRFPPVVVAGAKGDHRVTVCLPARNEEATVGAIVAEIRRLGERWGLVDEVLVVDDFSRDRTAEVAAAAGATVVAVSDVLPRCGPGTGKGEALWKGLAASTGDIVVFCDADIRDFDPAFVTGLLAPLLLDDGLAFVKGWYERPGDGGRVTELMARPLLSLLHPHLAGFRQPLAGEFAARREVLERLPFVQDYGVDAALLIDVAAYAGRDRVAQAFLGQREHRNRSLAELGLQAEQVAAAILERAGVDGVSVVERPPLFEVRGQRRSA
jgi:glucosyl-3-phosphoglycerate synthase